ncbi:phosphoribosylanthranilate isomerase [Desulfovibrio ferrophilus]|uniref:N-(5'-phosphoribosyl)anthranilate isomerase n=1 Tax=Desulfovibrio ferrophilus TaxID=241368 RepID=A0A2Z6B2N0_9BACT|nr:phosphoribosylanthranilate isomerase [Desulfovibrio ferrophilus]BBD09741.1 N-(5'-phosphoribosyl)anthranilate isomerase [Desulfovibrio ferrophilus]
MTDSRQLIKICGMTRQQDATACVDAGVDMTGFIFHESSPRNIQPGAAAAIDTGSALRVGVFVRQSQQQVLEIMDRAKLDLAQLCGDQDRAFCRAVGATRVIRVFWPERHKMRAALEDEMSDYDGCMAYALLDAGMSGGGHGRAQDFGLLRGLDAPVPWMLAGGLSVDNLPEAMAQCQPQGFDLNSGLESAPGLKDAELVRRAVALIRSGNNE